eukprot:6469015-Amphidinium_carterae.3
MVRLLRLPAQSSRARRCCRHWPFCCHSKLVNALLSSVGWGGTQSKNCALRRKCRSYAWLHACCKHLQEAIAEEELEEPHAAMVPADEDGKVKDTADTQPPSQLSAAGMEQVQPACEAVMRQHQEGDKIVIPSGRLELDELSSRTDEANFAACSKEPQEGQSHGTLLGDEATCAVCATEPHEGQGHGLVLGDEANHAVCATEPHEAQGHETLQGDEENGAVRATELPEEQCHERMQPDRVDRAADGPVQQDRVHQDAEPSAFQIAAIVEEEEADDDDDAASADE